MLTARHHDSIILAHRLREQSSCVSLMTRRSAIFIAGIREFYRFFENRQQQPAAPASDQLDGLLLKREFDVWNLDERLLRSTLLKRDQTIVLEHPTVRTQCTLFV